MKIIAAVTKTRTGLGLDWSILASFPIQGGLLIIPVKRELCIARCIFS